MIRVKRVFYIAAMDSKAKALLGLEESKEKGKVPARANGTVAKTSLYVQKKGFLSKKPFSAKSVVKHQKWQKRWFVLKDSFLIWYKSRPGKGDFDLHPAGVLPLGKSCLRLRGMTIRVRIIVRVI